MNPLWIGLGWWLGDKGRKMYDRHREEKMHTMNVQEEMLVLQRYNALPQEQKDAIQKNMEICEMEQAYLDGHISEEDYADYKRSN